MQPILLGGILSIAIFVLGLVGSSFYFYSIAIYRNRKEFLNDNEDLAPAQQNTERPPELSGREWLAQQVWEEWVLTSSDGLRLVGAYLPAPKGTNKTAVLVHGYTSQGKDMGSFARFYYEKLGFNVLLPDNRGHGQSGGNYIGFGWPDRLDYLLWLEEILKRVGEQAQIVLHGISMGGATVLMASGEDLPKQVKAIVADCGYTSVKDQLAYQLKRMYKLPSFPILSVTSLLTKLRAGYSFSEASALKQVAKAKIPILFIHGQNDTFVPTSMVWELYQACSSPKEIYIAEGAGHGTSYSTNRTMYEERVVQFLASLIS